MKKIKLFCLPYAGGSSVIFNNWKSQLSSFIDVIPIELAGRGKRFTEPLYSYFDDAVNDIFNIIKDNLEDPYAFFGHSMGCMLAYELCHKISEERLPSPLHVFFSGRQAPNIISDKEISYKLPRDEFKQKIIELGGTPDELFENEELFDLFLPILKADFKIVEEYEYIKKRKLDCNITILYGKEEHSNIIDITDWKKHTERNCSTFSFEGGHFFINDKIDEVLKVINNILINYIRQIV